MSRKGNQRTKSKKGRSLSSRKKRLKDVSSALLESEPYHRRQGTQMAEPPKHDFETQLPRKMREMMQAVQRAKDKEAGRRVEWRAHREDMPKPKQPSSRKRKHEQADMSPDTAGGYGDSAANVSDVKRIRKRPQDAADGAGAAVPHGNDEQYLPRPSSKESSKPIDFVRSKAPRFGETNVAPPDIRVGGQLKKKLQEQRVAAQKADIIARQREAAIKAYAAAKAARREQACASSKAER